MQIKHPNIEHFISVLLLKFGHVFEYAHFSQCAYVLLFNVLLIGNVVMY